MPRRWIVIPIACALLALVRPATAVRADMVPVFFSGVDGGAGPNSILAKTTGAASSFSAVAGPAPALNFTNALSPLISGGETFQLSPQVQMIASNLDLTAPAGYQFGISSRSNTDTTANNQWLGFNVGGEPRHFVVAPELGGVSTLTFVSTTPFNGFGFFLTGLGNVPSTTVTAVFTDSTGEHSKDVVGSIQGGALFFGALDPGQSLTQFQIRITTATDERDIFGISDIRFATVPEPASAFLVLLGLGGLSASGLWRARRRAPSAPRRAAA